MVRTSLLFIYLFYLFIIIVCLLLYLFLFIDLMLLHTYLLRFLVVSSSGHVVITWFENEILPIRCIVGVNCKQCKILWFKVKNVEIEGYDLNKVTRTLPEAKEHQKK